MEDRLTRMERIVLSRPLIHEMRALVSAHLAGRLSRT